MSPIANRPLKFEGKASLGEIIAKKSHEHAPFGVGWPPHAKCWSLHQGLLVLAWLVLVVQAAGKKPRTAALWPTSVLGTRRLLFSARCAGATVNHNRTRTHTRTHTHTHALSRGSKPSKAERDKEGRWEQELRREKKKREERERRKGRERKGEREIGQKQKEKACACEMRGRSKLRRRTRSHAQEEARRKKNNRKREGLWLDWGRKADQVTTTEKKEQQNKRQSLITNGQVWKITGRCGKLYRNGFGVGNHHHPTPLPQPRNNQVEAEKRRKWWCGTVGVCVCEWLMWSANNNVEGDWTRRRRTTTTSRSRCCGCFAVDPAHGGAGAGHDTRPSAASRAQRKPHIPRP